LNIPITLSPGTNPYHIQKIGNNSNNQALMIPTSPNSRPIPVTKIAGQRRRSKPLSKKLPPLTVLLPEDYNALPPLSERPNLTNIKFTQALPFAVYAQESNCKIFKITWRELDDLEKEEKQQREYLHSIKWTSTELTEQMARDVLLGQMDIPKLKQQINPRYHDFLDECCGTYWDYYSLLSTIDHLLRTNA
jgi:hypothetical protein